MKKFDMLTDEEILTLTDEEIQTYKELACAEAGVPFLPPIPEKPEFGKDVLPDQATFRIESFSIGNFDDYQKFMNFMNTEKIELVRTEYIPGPGCSRQIVDRPLEVNVHNEIAFSQKLWKQVGVAKEAYDTAKSEYLDALKEWKDINDARYNEIRFINERIEQARNANQEKNLLINYYNQYLELAKGDWEIAMNFLKKAYPTINNYPELIDSLLQTPQGQ